MYKNYIIEFNYTQYNMKYSSTLYKSKESAGRQPAQKSYKKVLRI